MGLSIVDKKEIILKYVRELGYRPVEISKGTGIPFYTINQMLQCEDWVIDEPVLNEVLHYLETGKSERGKHVFCTGSGCEALRAYIAEKDHLIKTQDDTIRMLREKIRALSK